MNPDKLMLERISFRRRILDDGYASYYKNERGEWMHEYYRYPAVLETVGFKRTSGRLWDSNLTEVESQVFAHKLRYEQDCKLYDEFINWLLSPRIPYLGLRGWGLIEDDCDTTRMRLCAVTRGYWLWDAVSHAECEVCQYVPGDDCECGLYAATSVEYARDISVYNDVFGLIAPWGKIIEYERGYRAEHARILLLVASSEYAAEAARKACPEVPVTTTWNGISAMVHGFTPEEIWPESFA